MSGSHASRIPSFAAVVAFHGHACPGLALGYRVAQAALKRLDSARSEDEEFVAVVENSACGVDAIQAVCGCTFGKGNLIFRDYGKQAFTFYKRSTGEGVRIYAEPVYMDDADDADFVRLVRLAQRSSSEEAQFQAIMTRRIERLLALPEEDFLRFSTPQEPMPLQARIFHSVRCDQCGERVMETRIDEINGRRLCRSCSQGQAGSTP